MPTAGQAICDAMMVQARRDIAAARLRAMQRPIGTKALEICYRWECASWAVWRVRWTGSEWRRYRRLTGPLIGSGEALMQLRALCEKLGLPRSDEV